MEPAFNLVVLPQEGRWTHNETSETGTFVGSVQLLISPIASNRTPLPILPLTFPIHLTLPLIPGYAWVGMNLPSADSVRLDVDRPTTLSPTSGEIPLSAYPPYDPATGCGFLLPGIPIDWSMAPREETPSVSRDDAPAVPSSPAGEATIIPESEEEEDPSEGSPC